MMSTRTTLTAVLLALLASGPAFSAQSAQGPLEFSRDAENRLWLTASSCTVLENQLLALRFWSERLGGRPDTASRECIDNGLDYQMEITRDVPAKAREVLGIKSKISGPNCWNASLVFSGMRDHLGYASDGDFKYVLARQCAEVREAELLPGDIIAIRHVMPEGNEVEVHGYIHLSPNLALTKNGSTADSPFELVSPSQVDRIYLGAYNSRMIKRYYRCVRDSAPDPARSMFHSLYQDSLRNMSKLAADLEAEAIHDSPSIDASRESDFQKFRLDLQEKVGEWAARVAGSDCDCDRSPSRLFKEVLATSLETQSIARQLALVKVARGTFSADEYFKSERSKLRGGGKPVPAPELDESIHFSHEASKALSGFGFDTSSPSIALRQLVASSSAAVPSIQVAHILLDVLRQPGDRDDIIPGAAVSFAITSPGEALDRAHLPLELVISLPDGTDRRLGLIVGRLSK